MEWVEVFIQYLRAYEQKDLDSVSDMFADDIAGLENFCKR